MSRLWGYSVPLLFGPSPDRSRVNAAVFTEPDIHIVVISELHARKSARSTPGSCLAWGMHKDGCVPVSKKSQEYVCCIFGNKCYLSSFRDRGLSGTEIGKRRATPNELLQATPQLTAAGQFGIPIWQPVSVVDPELV